MQKRGLSQVVTTIILILLILVAIGGIWAIVNNLIIKNAGKISTDSLTLSLTLRSAKIDYDTGIAEVRVRRNQGDGTITGIKFIAEDPRNSDVFERRFDSFPELAERTFELNLSESEILNLPEVYKISIAPIYVISSGSTGGGSGDSSGSGAGVEQIGAVSGSVSNLNENVNITLNTEEDEEESECTIDTDCPPAEFVSPRTCDESGTNVMQYKKTYSCVAQIMCIDETQEVIVESCPSGTTCYDGACVEEQKTCTPETIEQDCGVNGWVGILDCHQTENATIQDYKNYSCVDSACQVSTTSKIREYCEEGEICHNGECFIPLECTQNSDCDFGEVCKDGECLPELTTNSGTINSAWPYNVGEYFDSPDLPLEQTENVSSGYFVIFPGSTESRCMQITQFVPPTFDGGISYIQLDTTPNNLSNGDSYEIWETNYGCSLI